MSNPLDNLGAGCMGMYAAIKIFRHNGVDPHEMCDAILREVFNDQDSRDRNHRPLVSGIITGDKSDDATGDNS